MTNCLTHTHTHTQACTMRRDKGVNQRHGLRFDCWKGKDCLPTSDRFLVHQIPCHAYNHILCSSTILLLDVILSNLLKASANKNQIYTTRAFVTERPLLHTNIMKVQVTQHNIIPKL